MSEVHIPTEEEFAQYQRRVFELIAEQGVDPLEFEVEVVLRGTYVLAPAILVRSTRRQNYSAVRLGAHWEPEQTALAQAQAVASHARWLEQNPEESA